MVKLNSTIFRTITDEVTGANKSIGLFGKSFTELKNILNSVRTNGLSKTNLISDTDIQCIKDYNFAITNGVPHLEAMEQATKGASSATTQMIKNANGNTIALDKMTLGAKAASVAMKVLSIAGNMLVMVAISKGIELATKAWYNYAHAVENAREKLEETTSELESVESEIANVNSQIDELLSKETPTITDENDLKRLQEENSQLKIRKALLDAQKAEESAELNREIEKKYKKNYSDNGMNTTDENGNVVEGQSTEEYLLNELNK